MLPLFLFFFFFFFSFLFSFLFFFNATATTEIYTLSLHDALPIYYGTPTAVSQVANVTVSDARTLTVTPWEKNMVQPIEKAIMESDLGINPATAGTVIRLPMPPLTEERRKDLVKLSKVEGENGKVAIRNIRRDANNHIKGLLKKKEISEDDDKRGEESIQKLTDKFVSQIDSLISGKEKDIMEI